MYLIQNSKDFLYVVIALSVFIFTFFICWGMFYFAMILRQMFTIIKEMRLRIKKVDETFKAIKEKIEHSTSYLSLIGEGVSKIANLVNEYSKKGKKKKK